MLRQRDAWSLDKTTEDLTSHPRTPDSGLAPSLGETVSRRGLADSPNGSSRGSQVADPTEDNVFDDNLSRSHLRYIHVYTCTHTRSSRKTMYTCLYPIR